MNAPAQPSKTVLLQVSGLCAWYGAAQILFDVELSLQRGEVLALMGRNGAGKSTTFKAIMGLTRRRAHTLDFMGHDIRHARSHEIARLGLAYVPEDRRIFTDLTVAENLRTGRQPPRRWPDGTDLPAWDVDAVLELFPNLAPMLSRRADQMSGGEQQMLSVARSLMGNPYVVLLDEPSEGVAPIIVERMTAMIQAVRARGVSVLLSEQNLDFAGRVANRAIVLEKGQVAHQGPMQVLMEDAALRARYLGL
ncbi:MAG: ABC transporter ATP-binding protein [Castellaniella sp.]